MNNNHITLDVYAKTDKVGTLSFTSSMNCSFEYDKAWHKHGFAISPHLPFHSPVDTKSTFRFFRNLLPEGCGLECLLNVFHLSRHDLMGQLKHIAQESAGILHFEHPDIDLYDTQTLTEQALALRISQNTNVAIFDGIFRLGVAGVQKKINVHISEDVTAFTLGSRALPSTHILKFEPSSSFLVLNEWFCMRLAKAIVLPVSDVSLGRLTGANREYLYLIVDRFDRVRHANGTISKRHIIDGCQALNLPPEHKYERIYGSHPDVAHCREGASLFQLFGFVREHCESDDAIYNVLVWLCFNLIIGNSDAHAKNISFYVDEMGIHLTPFYDLVSIVFEALDNPKLDTDLAMAIGDEFDINAVTAYHLLCFAEEVNVAPEQLKHILGTVATECMNIASVSLCQDTPLSRMERRFLVQLISTIKQRAKYFLDEVALFDEIQHTLF